MEKVDIVICTSNNIILLGKVLDSVNNQTFKSYACWVVNDLGDIKISEFVNNNYPWVNYIATTSRNGAAENRNLAIVKGKSEYVVTLDDDVVLGEKWLEKVVKFMENYKDVGIMDAFEPYRYNTFFESYCSTAAMIMRRKVFEDVIGFDKDYFYGLDDTDFCLRAKRKGWNIKTNYAFAYAVHKNGSTVSNFPDWFVPFHYWKNYIRTILKNCSVGVLFVKLFTLLVGLFVLFLFSLLRGKNVLVIPRAVWWNVKNFPDTLRRRKNYA